MKVVAISGTPGTGKTTLSKRLAEKLDFYYVDSNKLISKYKLSEGYDKKRRTKIVDVKKLNDFLINLIEQFKKSNKKYNGIIIDSHLSHHLPKEYVDICIVAKCNIKELNKRLKKRGYRKNKIQENLQAEIFDICYLEALEQQHNVIAVDTTKGFNISSIAGKLGG